MKKNYFLLLFIFFYSCEKDITFPDNIIKDIDNNTYNVITIGAQQWMKENLKTTRFNNGVIIPLIYNGEKWHVLNVPACTQYNINDCYKEEYGKLYNWFAVETGKLCPVGWHVPSNMEWTQLINYIGGDSIAGGKLKEEGLSHWQSPNLCATNEYGFTALPGGFCDYTGEYLNFSAVGFWWTSTEIVQQTNWDPPVEKAWNKILHKHTKDIYGIENIDYPYPKQAGMSVRCIKNSN